MGKLRDILAGGAKEIITEVGQAVDKLTTSEDEKLTHKERISEIVLTALNKVQDNAASVIKTEMSGNWLQKSWRPIGMLTLITMLVLKWNGLTDPNIPIELEKELLEIVKYGFGGYVVGRSVEKVADKVTSNIDMSFLKKKDRKINI
jgi:hypothetical protein